MDKFSMDGNCNASRNEQKKLAAYLRNKDRNGTPLTLMETRILNQINDYTYLPRYGQDVPSHIYTKDDNGRWHRDNGQYASNAEMGLDSKNSRHKNGEVSSNYTSWKNAENRLADMVGGDSQHYFVTSDGKKRFVDQFDPNRVAHESKAGYTTLTRRVQEEISKDVQLREAGDINGIHWHFFTSEVTGECGASKPLLDELRNNNIEYTNVKN